MILNGTARETLGILGLYLMDIMDMGPEPRELRGRRWLGNIPFDPD